MLSRTSAPRRPELELRLRAVVLADWTQLLLREALFLVQKMFCRPRHLAAAPLHAGNNNSLDLPIRTFLSWSLVGGFLGDKRLPCAVQFDGVKQSSSQQHCQRLLLPSALA